MKLRYLNSYLKNIPGNVGDKKVRVQMTTWEIKTEIRPEEIKMKHLSAKRTKESSIEFYIQIVNQKVKKTMSLV